MTSPTDRSSPTPAPTPGSAPAAAPAKFPVFYKSPQLMTLQAHGAMALERRVNYAFARQTNAIPVNLVEFRNAAPWYPIVFGPKGSGAALAIVGLMPDANAFVSADGNWREADYIPAYVRRYPFVVAQMGGDKKLCVDVSSDRLKPKSIAGDDSDPLFNDGQPGTVTLSARSFCASYDDAAIATKGFVDQLDRLGLLVDRSVTARFDNGKEQSLSGFRVVDEEKLQALAGKTVIDMHRRGWLAGLHAHLISTNAWSRVRRLSAPS